MSTTDAAFLEAERALQKASIPVPKFKDGDKVIVISDARQSGLSEEYFYTEGVCSDFVAKGTSDENCRVSYPNGKSQLFYIINLVHISDITPEVIEEYKLKKEAEELKRKKKAEEQRIKAEKIAQIAKEKAEKVKGQITEITEALYSTDCDVQLLNANTIQVIVLLPEVHLSNSKRNKHTIYDLYLRYTFKKQSSDNQWRMDIPQGLRGKQSTAEIECGYQHSHLHQRNEEYKFGTFCLGHTDIAMDVAELNRNFNPKLYEKVLLGMEELAKWESLEGVPYISITKIGNRDDSLRDVSTDVCKKLYNQFLKLGLAKSTKFTFMSVSNSYVPQFDEEKLVHELKADAEYHCTKINGEYYNIGVNNRESHVRNTFSTYMNGSFKFRDTLIKPEILKETMQETKSTVVLHPNILNYIKGELQNDFKEYLKYYYKKI